MAFLVRHRRMQRVKLGIFLAINSIIFVGVYYKTSRKWNESIIYPDESEVFIYTCSDSISASDIDSYLDHDTLVIYFITPTYARREQVAELTRLLQTLIHIKVF